jgi:hypothetical protein
MERCPFFGKDRPTLNLEPCEHVLLRFTHPDHIPMLYVEMELDIDLRADPDSVLLLAAVRAILAQHTVGMPGIVLANEEGRERARSGVLRLLREHGVDSD